MNFIHFYSILTQELSEIPGVFVHQVKRLLVASLRALKSIVGKPPSLEFCNSELLKSYKTCSFDGIYLVEGWW